jgi:hypothetical protein
MNESLNSSHTSNKGDHIHGYLEDPVKEQGNVTPHSSRTVITVCFNVTLFSVLL